MSGRAERPSPKKSVAPSGSYLGWSCMSCRQPAASTAETSDMSEMRVIAAERIFLVLHLFDHPRGQPLEEAAGVLAIEHRVGRLDAEEEAIACGQREARHVEHRVVR